MLSGKAIFTFNFVTLPVHSKHIQICTEEQAYHSNDSSATGFEIHTPENVFLEHNGPIQI